MPLPLLPKVFPTPDAFVELALIGSIAGRADASLRPVVVDEALRQFWSANRKLQNQWIHELRSATGQLSDSAADNFERIALELFLTELLTRVWATNWTISDRLLGRRDVERVMSNSLQGLSRVRRDVLLLMVRNWRGPAEDCVSRLDRFRRRSERWADLLIASPAAEHDVWDFAVEIDRARDFGEEDWSRRAGAANPVSLLVSAGLRVMFGTSWPRGCCTSEPFAELLSAIPVTLPPQAFAADGSLRPVWDWEG